MTTTNKQLGIALRKEQDTVARLREENAALKSQLRLGGVLTTRRGWVTQIESAPMDRNRGAHARITVTLEDYGDGAREFTFGVPGQEFGAWARRCAENVKLRLRVEEVLE